MNTDDSDLIERDENEIELEKLVFGDREGFQNELHLYGSHYVVPSKGVAELSRQEDQEALKDAGVESLDDADLFFLDSGPSSSNDTIALSKSLPNLDVIGAAEPDSDAWVDSDDERLSVSLASNPRLRKLRITESEDQVNGREYVKRLRQQYERLYPVPDWVNHTPNNSQKRRRKSFNNSESSEDIMSQDDASIDSQEISTQPLIELLQNAGGFSHADTTMITSTRRLRPDTIDVQRTKDVGTAQPSSITSLAFHPTRPLLLSSGPSSTLSLHHVSPQPPNPNPLLTTLHLRSTPLTTSLFLPSSGDKIFFSGRRRYFHVWDLKRGTVERVSRIIDYSEAQRSMERFKLSPCGRWMGLVGSGRKGGGIINILDTNTCQWIAEVRVEGKGGVADFEWWGNGEGLLVIGKAGEAMEWDRRQNRVVARWIDDGAVGITVVALGRVGTGPKSIGGDRWVAVGSSSGITNVYDRKQWLNVEAIPGRPKPARTFDHLIAPISHLQFSPDGQVLCMASRWQRDALRLVHLPSCTVYRNWPTRSTPLGRITSVAWSPNSEMLAIANEQGKIRLWEVRS